MVPTVAKTQLDAYVSYDGLNLENNPPYQEAKSLKQKHHEWTATEKSRDAFLNLANAYMEQAKQGETPQYQAFFYAHVRQICAKDLEYVEEAEKLKEQAIFQEARACLDAAHESTAPSLQAAWAFKSARLLDPHPTKLPCWSDPTVTSEKYTLAATSWETLADIFFSHKKDVSLSYASLISDYSSETKYLAAKFYENAAYSIRNANFITQFREKKCNWNSLDARIINLLDKSISVLESQGLKINDFVFNAEYFEMLAGLYQFKINTYKTSHGEAPNLSDLRSKVFEFRKKSAKLYSRIVEENPTFTQYYYNIALNLREAALHVKTVGEAAALLKRAADSAATFRESKHVPLSHTTGGEDEKESDAHYILVSHGQMDKLLEEKGPDHPLPERK